MKGHAIEGRYNQKDAYDIYYCIRNYAGDPRILPEHADHCSITPAAQQAMASLPRSSILRTASGRHACVDSSKTPKFLANAPRTSGRRMHSAKWMRGCAHGTEGLVGSRPEPAIEQTRVRYVCTDRRRWQVRFVICEYPVVLWRPRSYFPEDKDVNRYNGLLDRPSRKNFKRMKDLSHRLYMMDR
jgi:hypothetical protein